VESDESEGEEEERETEEEGQTVAEHVMPPAVLNSTVDKDEVPTVATLCDNNTDDGAKKVQEEPGVVEVEAKKAGGEEKQEFVSEKCADEAEAEITSPGQCCESDPGSGTGAFLILDPGSGIGFFGSRTPTHIFDSLMTNFGQKVIQFLGTGIDLA
jgi:hypothetical protein